MRGPDARGVAVIRIDSLWLAVDPVDMLAGGEPRPRIETEPQRTAEELLALLPAVTAEFDAVAHAHPVDQIVSAVRGGKSYSFTRGAVLTHVTTHGMHHRAQCLNMLKQLGVKPLPHSSVAEWTWLGDLPK